jgi:hypothetical protein
VFFLIGAYAARGIAWWPFAAVAGLAPLIGEDKASVTQTAGTPRPMRLANAVVAIAIVLAGVTLLPVWRPTDPDTNVPQGVLSQAPSGLTGAVREAAAPGDRLVAPQPWASWFEFATPDLPVAVDSRIELFPNDIWSDYLLVTRGGAGWEDVLASWDAQLIVADDSAFVERLLAAGWTERYTDDAGSLLVRSKP